MLANRLLLCFLLFVLPLAAPAAVMVEVAPTTTAEVLQNISADEFLNLSPKDIRAQTGEKLKFGERIALRAAQRKVKKALKHGESLDFSAAYDDARGGFNIGGFLLGFFLGPIGVLLALLFGGSAFRSSLIGLLCAILVVLLGWAVF